MTSLPVRDPVGDHLLTPQNSALVVIDYQPSQFGGVTSTDHDLLLENIVSTVKTAKAFDLPIIHSTINVATGRPSSMRSAAPARRPTAPVSSASFRPVQSRSPGSPSRSSSSATGHAKRQWPM